MERKLSDEMLMVEKLIAVMLLHQMHLLPLIYLLLPV